MTIVTGDTEPESFVVRQAGIEGTLGELAYALRAGTVPAAAVDLLALVDSFLRHFEAISSRSLELASVALPGVAQVIELKLRLLLPRPPATVDEEEILEETIEAVALLEELEDAVDFLRERRDARRIMLPASTPRPDYPRPERPLGAAIEQLARLASRYRSGGYFELTVDRLSMGGAMEGLLATLRRWGRGMLHEVGEDPAWPQLTVYFAGMLELVREGRVRASQETPYGEIELELLEVEAADVA